MSRAKTGEGSDGEAARTPFGLEADEVEVFAETLATLTAPLGLDGRSIVTELTRGRTLGQALQLPAGLADLLYGRAHGLFNAGRHDRSEPLFRALCMIEAPVADYWIGYGLCLRERDAEAEAALAFATAAALRPGWAVPQFHAAQLALAQGRWADAAEHLGAFHERDGGDVPAGMRRDAARQSRALEARVSANEDAAR